MLLEIKGIEIYLFGGFVRDLLLGLNFNDVDLKIIICSKDKVQKRKELVVALSSFDPNISISKVPLGGILLRSKINKFDVIVYSSKNKFVYETDFVINSLHINLKNGQYFFNKGYLRSLLKKKIDFSKYLSLENFHLIRGIYLYCKLQGFSFSIDFRNSIKNHVNELLSVFWEYCHTTDEIKKNELEKYIFSPLEFAPGKSKQLWFDFGFTHQLEIFLERAKTDREIFFQDRLDRLNIYAKKLHE